jgi:hypothetical protein
MAGDWIKMRADLFTHPKVVRISSALQADTLRTVGGLMSVWCLFDAHSEDGALLGYTPETIDQHLRWPGFASAMAAVGWLQETPESLVLPEFETHNGASAKRRAQDSERKRNVRNLSACEADKTRTREEKRREEIVNNASHCMESATPIPVPAGLGKLPDCPHEKIIALYHELLPTLPRVAMWTEKRKGYLRSRWREMLLDEKANTEDAGIEIFRDLFTYVGQSKFLTGRVPPTNGRKPFKADLEWILNPSNFVKIAERKYE